MMQVIVQPKANGGGIEFRYPDKKGFIVVNESNGHWYMQYHAACGYLTSYVHQAAHCPPYTEDGLSMPKYVNRLIKAGNNLIDSLTN